MSEILKFIQFNQYNLPVFIEILGIYLGVLWLAVIAWIIRDITTRSSNVFVISLCIILVTLGNLPGLVIYLLLRPEKTIEEGKNKELFFASVLDSNINLCPHCHNLVRTDFSFCPYCSSEVNAKCPNCHQIINSSWSYCVNCNTKLVAQPKLSIIFSTIGHRFIAIFNFKKYFQFFSRLRAKSPKLHLPTLPKIKIDWQFVHKLPKFSRPEVKPAALKVFAAKKTEPKLKTKVLVAPVPVLKKRGRGRPSGTSDKKPRKPRADAGKVRGKYKTEKKSN